MIQIADIVRGGAKSIGFMYDELRFVVQALYGAVVNRNTKVVQNVFLMST